MLLQRWFFILPVVTVCVNAFLAARTVSHLIEARLVGRIAPPRLHARRARALEPQRRKEAEIVAERNMFCSDCQPVEAAPEAVATSDGRPPLTSLPLALVAVFGESYATVTDGKSGRAGLYAVGEIMPEAGPIRRVGARSILFWNERAKRLERVDLVAVAVAAAPVPPRKKDAPGVTRVDDRHFQLDRTLVEKLLADPAALAKEGRVAPWIVDGKPVGFRVAALKADSLLAAIGLREGDVIRSVNGTALTSADRILDAYTKLRSSSSLAVTMTVARAGTPVEIEYAIR